MKKNGRRVLGLLLLLIMMFTLVPSPNIFALGEEEESVAVESEVTPEEQMVEIANDILSDIDGEEDKEETEPDTEPVTEADSAEGEASVTEDEASEEEMLEVDPAENEDSKDMLPETNPEVNSESEPEGETVSEEVESDGEEDEEYELPPFSADAGNIEITAITTNKAFDVPVNLVASVIPEEDNSYKEAEDALDNSGKQYDGMLVLDIHFEDENQNEVEPNRPVNVSFKVKKAAIEEVAADTSLIVPETVEVNHITSNDGGETVAEKVADFADETDGSVFVSTSATAEGESVEQINASFEVDGFSTFVITWGEGTPQPSATIHWGTKSGGVFTEFAQDMVANLDTSAASISVANTFDGYYYSATSYIASGSYSPESAVNMLPTLYKTSSGWEYVQLTEGVDGTVETRVPVAANSNIYVSYVAINPDDPIPSGSDDDDVPSPTTTKDVESNGDGTYTITLDVTGAVVSEDHSHYANVLIVLDATTSMRGDKWTSAKTAINTLINVLTTGDNAANKGNIDFSLVTFGRQGVIREGTWNSTWTNNTDAFQSWIRDTLAINTTTGTNWESGLYYGYDALTQRPDNEPTYVIFVTDGDPYGHGRNNYNQTGDFDDHAEAAYDEAYDIAHYSNTKLYGIFTGEDNQQNQASLSRLRNVISNNGGVKTILATPAQIESEFKEIAQTIVEEMGANNVTVDDGIPSLSNVSSSVVGKPGGYEYYISTDGTNFNKWNDAPGASYSNDNGVTWDLSSVSVVPGTTYRIKFTVWPSQEAYDYIADLNNGLVNPVPTEAELLKQGIQKGTDGKYFLLTNTHLNTTYEFGGNTYSDSPEELPSEAMALPTETIKVKKVWNNKLDLADGEPVNLKVLKDGEVYLNSVPVNGNTDPAWVSDSIFISLGQITQNLDTLEYEVIEPGHDYELIEPEEFHYRWELTSEIYHPMVINGVATMLIKDEDATGTDGVDYYSIKDKDGKTVKYVKETGENVLKAFNDRRSWLQVEKFIEKTDLTVPDELFEFTVSLTDPKGEDFWFSVFDPNAETNPVKGLTTTAIAEVGTDGNETGYYHADSGSSITVEIKAGWTLRFTNLRSGTTYTIEETSLPDGFKFVEAEGRVVDQTSEEADQADPIPAEVEEGSMVASGTINVPNCEFYVDYTNKYELTNISVTKSWVDNSDQDAIRPSAEAYKEYITLLANGEEYEYDSESVTFAVTDNGDNTYTISYTGLPKYIDNEEATYTVEESSITGYTTSGNNPAANGQTIINIHTPEVVVVKVTKSWSDANNQDGIRPESVEIVLTGPTGTTYSVTLDGTTEDAPTGTTATGYESDAWEATFVNLPKNASGTAITYTASETKTDVITGTDGPGTYTFAVSGSAANGFTVTNTHTPEKTEATVKKVWDDADDQDGIRPDSLKVKLSNGTEVTLNDENKWTATVTDLPKYSNGSLVSYTWTEDTLPEGYTLTGNVVSGTVTTLTNSYTPEVTSVTVTKSWSDGDNQDGIRPTSVEVVLTGSDNKEYKVTLNGEVDTAVPTTPGGYESDKWVATFVNLPKNASGEPIEYTASETTTSVITGTDGPGTYAFAVSGSAANGFTVTNTHTPEVKTVTVTKVWSDGDNQDGIRPTSVEVVLTGSDGETYNVTLDGTPETAPEETTAGGYESTAWTATYVNLPKYAGTTTEVTYTASETTTSIITGKDGAGTYAYEVTGSEANGFTVTNTHTPEEVEIVVEKEWVDNGPKSRPESITIHLLTVTEDEDGNEIETDTGKSLKLDSTGEWKGSFTKLPKFDNGEKINYKVSEDEVEGYEVSYSDVTEVSGENNAVPVSEGDAQPDTGDGTPIDPVDEAVSGDDAGDATSTEETAVTTYKVTVTNTLTTIDIEIDKTVEQLFDAGGDSNATFVFEITVQGADEEKPKYHGFAGITYGVTPDNKVVLSGIPYAAGDTITIEEVYTAGHIEVTEKTKKGWVTEDLYYKAEFTNTFDDIPYSSGIVNRGLHEGNELVIVQEEQQEEEQFR